MLVKTSRALHKNSHQEALPIHHLKRRWVHAWLDAGSAGKDTLLKADDGHARLRGCCPTLTSKCCSELDVGAPARAHMRA